MAGSDTETHRSVRTQALMTTESPTQITLAARAADSG